MTDADEITVYVGPHAECQTISEALKAVGDGDGEPVRILVGEGTYRERLEIRRSHLTIQGAGADRCRIVYGLGAKRMADDGIPLGTFRTATVLVDAHDVTMCDLTIENDAGDGREVGQAIALYADGDRLVFDRCHILGHQDTLFTGPLPPKEMKPNGFIGPKQFAPRINGRQYYRDCLIEGDVDFVFGSATALFDGCELRSLDRGEDVNGYVTASSTAEGQRWGYVFSGCRLASQGCADKTVYLGRPWRDYAHVAFVGCEMGAHIKSEGWWDWDKPQARSTIRFEGADLTGPGARTNDWPSWTRMLDAGEQSHYTREGVLAGDDGWDPLASDTPRPTAANG